MSKISHLIATIVLGLLTLALLALAEVRTGAGPVLVLLSGMTAMAAFASLRWIVESDAEPSRSVDIRFNERAFSRSISDAWRIFVPDTTLEHKRLPRSKPWDLTTNELVGVDNALALARMRMDIESELRRIAQESGVSLSHQGGVVNLARELVAREIVPATWLSPLADIVTVCNRGIHGVDVSDDTARSVTRVGGQLLEGLAMLPVSLRGGSSQSQ